jgi:hypothetical protein
MPLKATDCACAAEASAHKTTIVKSARLPCVRFPAASML